MDWRSIEARVDSTMRAAFGEEVRLSPMDGGVSDPDRSQWIGRAILHAGGDDSHSAGDGFRTRLAAGEAELFLDRATYTGPAPKQGDVVRSLDREGQPAWSVRDVSDRYSNLIVVSLSQV